jgi:hypothetical protein
VKPRPEMRGRNMRFQSALSRRELSRRAVSPTEVRIKRLVNCIGVHTHFHSACLSYQDKNPRKAAPRWLYSAFSSGLSCAKVLPIAGK